MTTTKDGYTENATIHDIRDAELNERLINRSCRDTTRI